MTQQEFHNALRILMVIDRWDVKWMDDMEWQEFIANPHRFFIRADDPTADALWAVIEKRNRLGANARAALAAAREGRPCPK